MAKSRIEITFNSNPVEGNSLVIQNSLTGILIYETFKTTRTYNGETAIGFSNLDTAQLYGTSVNTDYNGAGIYTISVNAEVVTIQAVSDNVVFSVISNITGGAVTTAIFNETVTPPLLITNVSYSEADSLPCGNVKVNVTTNSLATKVTSPVLIDPNGSNPFSFDYVRGQTITISCETATESFSGSYTLPKVLSADNVTINKFGTPTGANVTISVTNTTGLSLQYSLDNVTFQTSNAFNGLLIGDYTVYVKDQLGCFVGKSFVIDDFTPDVSVFEASCYIDPSNSIRYKTDIEWDNFENYKTIDNTLSCEELVNSNYSLYRGYHLFQTNDIIKTQFLSNYDTISANVVNEDGSKDPLTITLKKQFINIKDKRDAVYYSYSDTQLGVYFTSGDTYDYDTELANGTYSLNGNLPVYGAVNNYIYINGIGWFQIREIVYDENVDASVILVDYNYDGLPTIEIVSSIYNQQNYNVYEFEVNFATYEDKYVQIEILQEDAKFGTYNYLSEIIDVKAVHENSLELIWYNANDNRMFWSTGIKSKARILFEYFQNSPDTTTEVNKTDTTVILINSDNYRTYKLEFGIQGTALSEKMVLPPLHKEFYINRVKYVANGSPEVENIVGTNINVVSYNLTKAGDVFKSEFNGISNTTEEIVGLIQSDNQYLALG